MEKIYIERPNFSLKKLNDNDITLYMITDNKLAYELAEALDDLNAIQVYIHFTEKYSESFLREILNKVQSIPDRKIRKSRGALFTFMVKQNASPYRSRD